jgi:RNA polymerase sigma factor (sigma-70 family)
MQDSEIVTATAAGEPDGLAAAYDRYAAPLLAFCCALLGERADAVDAVQDTFVVAAAQLEGLTEPDQLRPWLYAVARNECHRKLSARAHADGDGAPGSLSDDTIDFGVNVERAELDEVVRAALAGLDPAEREAIEMSLRQAFSPDDLASALSLSRNQASTLASRARGEYARTLGTLLVARAGRPYCSKLDEMLDGWDGNLTVLLRKRLSRHIRMCRTCTERRRRELEPALMLSVLPAVEIARGLRPQVLQLAASSAPEAVAYRASVVRRAAPFDDQGFPVPIDPPKVVRRARRPVIVVSAAAALALLAAVGFEAGLANNHPGTDAAAASLGNQAGVPQAAGASTSSGSSSASSGGHGKRRSLLGPASSASITPGVTPSGTLTITPTSPGSTSPTSPSTGPSSTPPSSTPPSSSPPPISGTLSASPGSVTLGESPSGGYPTGSFTLSATGGSVTYSVSPPSGYAEELIVSPSSGTLAAGQSITITVTWESSATMDADLAVGPDGPGVSVAYDAPTPAPSPTPSTEPTTASPAA